MAKMILGTHAANMGGKSALMANVADTVCIIIYAKLRAKPMPRYMPMPPLRLRDDNEAPIMVRMKDANDAAIRL